MPINIHLQICFRIINGAKCPVNIKSVASFNRETDRRTDGRTDRQRQADRQRERQRDRDRECETDRQSSLVATMKLTIVFVTGVQFVICPVLKSQTMYGRNGSGVQVYHSNGVVTL